MAERRPPQRAGDKLALLLGLVPYLIDEVRVSVTDAAAQFDVTPDQMRALVGYLTGTGDPGPDGLYLPQGLFDIDWDDFEERDIIRFRSAPLDQRPRLSSREAAALLAGLQAVSAMPGFSERADVERLMTKLARGASGEVAPVSVQSRSSDALRETVAAAVTAGDRLRIDYVTTRGDREERDVDPIRLESVDDVWYLRGWCLTRDAERTFRLDRMASAEAIGPAESHAPSTTDAGELFRSDADDLLVTVELPASALPLLSDYLGADDSVEYAGNRAIARIPLAHEGVIGRLAARIAGVGAITAPPEARRAAAAWARAALGEPVDEADTRSS
ncbi:WYL domain-containing protein [Microcella alkalica]|uniref:Proteasome accessory factor C n=1 Tax=Microcella alkalica TaxID=355930 RepID=A0A839ECY6_9MICO|nr:WYL domain-containing protein [Microcella alkalica]MBA8847195.1 proteasome accessory factor C [Microcella alkalica]